MSDTHISTVFEVCICDECDEVCNGTDEDRAVCCDKNPNWRMELEE